MQRAHGSVWDDLPDPPRPALGEEIEADVAILGGGIAGASLAWHLRGAGRRVALLEGTRIAAGATGRSGGFLLSGTAAPLATAVRTFGLPRALRTWRVTEENHRLLREAIREGHVRCDHQRTGSWRIAMSEAEREVLRDSAEIAAREGLGMRWVDAADLPAALRRPAFFGGTFQAGDGEVHPARLAAGLASAAERAGVRIFEGTPALGLSPDGAGVRIRCDRGGVRASIAAVCLNAWIPRLLPGFEERVRPVRGQVLATAPLPERLHEGVFYAKEGYIYWRQLPDGRLLLGGFRFLDFDGEVGYEDRLHPRIQAALEGFLPEILDGRKPPIERRWTGTMAFPCDGMPIVGPLPGDPAVLLAGAFQGHGLALGHIAAKWLSDLILHGRSEAPAEWSPRRFA